MLQFLISMEIDVLLSAEIYGSPEVHPQKEDYWGCVNPVGTRSCYDEGQYFVESTRLHD